MKIGDLLLIKGVINKKQLQAALSKQAEEAITYNRSVPLGKILIEEGHVSVDEVAEVLNTQQQEIKAEKKEKERPMATEIGEGSQFTFDLKFIATMGAILVSACGVYFSITGQLNELKSNNSPNRLEHDYVVKEIDNIKSMGDLKIISYKLDEYDEMFTEIKELVKQLQPLASDLEYIKSELNKLKERKIDIPEIDLSGLETAIDKVGVDVKSMQNSLGEFEERLNKVERKGGGRF